jgi:hypothetical protein
VTLAHSSGKRHSLTGKGEEVLASLDFDEDAEPGEAKAISDFLSIQTQ